MQIDPPYLLFLGDVADALAAKTAQGVVDWRPQFCLGQMRHDGCKADTGLPDMSPREAVAKGAKSFVIGAVNAGGVLPDHWVASIVEAIDAGLDIVSGLHLRLADHPTIGPAAKKASRRLFDLRSSTEKFATGKGTKRSGLRLLTVGTDCSVGKKYAALVLEKKMREYGLDADFRATGQTGVLIAGRGVAIDAVIADFISGAAEWLSPAADPHHWDVIEGQGSLFHPSFAGVSLGLLHGSQPDAFVVCHEPTRKTMRGVEAPIPAIADVIEATIAAGRLTNPDIRCVGIALNTAALSDDEARTLIDSTSAKYNLPTCDPMRFGAPVIVERIISEFPA
ncbi:MAG: DUF1611 domain-containing protein [Hyphomicrobiales bacterium]|nr:DUF1611 domain-containing protein [Hyphomicrobiales bacterium]